MKLIRRILSAGDPTSSKRLVTLVIAAHFIIASFVILFFAFYVIVVEPKGMVKPEILQLLQNVMEYDFYIILAGLGFITGENLGQVLLEKAKVAAAGSILTPQPTVTTVDNSDTVNIESSKDQEGDPAHEIKQELKDIKKNLVGSLKKKEIIG